MRFFYPVKKEYRLRVIASGNSAAEQATKCRVRDGVLPVLARTPFDTAAVRAAAHAVDPTARVRLGVLRFGGYASPALEIALGAGKGRNWWGVLFPDACGLPDGPVMFRSWIVMLLKGWGWL